MGTEYVAYRPVWPCGDGSGDWSYISAEPQEFDASMGEGTNIQYYYVATLPNLGDKCGYEYSVGKAFLLYSDVFTFYTRTPSEDSEEMVRAVIYGDLGSTNNTASLSMLDKEFNETDIVFHIGDFAYNLDSDDGTIGDDFFNQI
jgi:hypothetical protein